jgi:hypothetical protein
MVEQLYYNNEPIYKFKIASISSWNLPMFMEPKDYTRSEIFMPVTLHLRPPTSHFLVSLSAIEAPTAPGSPPVNQEQVLVCWDYYYILKLVAVSFSETPVTICRATWRDVPEVSNHQHEDFFLPSSQESTPGQFWYTGIKSTT